MTGKDLAAVDPARYERDRARVEDGFWDKVRRTAGRVPFVEEAVAAYYCAFDRDTPLQVKAILMGALAYFVMPADMLPDVLLLFGFTDDAAVLAAAIRTVTSSIKPSHRLRARLALGTEGEEQAVA